jgi:hypothetical protein
VVIIMSQSTSGRVAYAKRHLVNWVDVSVATERIVAEIGGSHNR